MQSVPGPGTWKDFGGGNIFPNVIPCVFLPVEMKDNSGPGERGRSLTRVPIVKAGAVLFVDSCRTQPFQAKKKKK